MANAMGELRMTGDREGTRREQESGTLQARRHHTAPHRTAGQKGQKTACSQQGRSESKQCAWWVQGPTLPLRDARERERDRERLSAGIPSINLGPQTKREMGKSPRLLLTYPYHSPSRAVLRQAQNDKQAANGDPRHTLTLSHTPLFFPNLVSPCSNPVIWPLVLSLAPGRSVLSFTVHLCSFASVLGSLGGIGWGKTGNRGHTADPTRKEVAAKDTSRDAGAVGR
ncbi:hypothetical protein CCHR01_16073 [Colletotrichum chrysophilum]|uniref:Uncharacterized protein n=1 Tax=Colletotrichum chrysophilum TaxID=1836956 RepID=A0AAD9E843_9PEZI|nr:hypothetical protein CCHR01_16073 [Colletotrichum chrysophilum]